MCDAAIEMGFEISRRTLGLWGGTSPESVLLSPKQGRLLDIQQRLEWSWKHSDLQDSLMEANRSLDKSYG